MDDTAGDEHYETFPLFPAPQPHDPVTGDNLGDPLLPTLPQMRQMVAYSHDELPNLTLTRDHDASQPVGKFTSLWLDESGKAPRVMAQVKFDKTPLGEVASMAVGSRWYDAISPEWNPLSDTKTGKVVAHMLTGASITPIPRQKGGEHGTWVFGHPAQKKAAPSNRGSYKGATGDTLATQINSTTTVNMSDNTTTMKASVDASETVQAMDVVEPATLQGVEGTTEAHPQDTNRGGKAEAEDVTLRGNAFAAMQARIADLTSQVQQQQQANQKWATYQQQQEQGKKEALSLEQKKKMAASMDVAKRFRNEIWAQNVAELNGTTAEQVRRLKMNPGLCASMDAVNQAIDENDPEKLQSIEGSAYMLSQMESELNLKKEADAAAEKKRMEDKIRAKIEAEQAAKFQSQGEAQLGQLNALQSQIDQFKAVPLPPQLNTPAAAPVPAPMDLQAQPAVKASLDSGMSSTTGSSSSTTTGAASSSIDKFEQRYGFKRSQVVGEETLKASLDNTSSFVRDGNRCVARPDQRFRDIALAGQLGRYEQAVYYGGQLPFGVEPLNVEECVRAALDTPIGERAVRWKPTENCINPNDNPAGVMMVRFRR
jgi:hypothetical protein